MPKLKDFYKHLDDAQFEYYVKPKKKKVKDKEENTSKKK